MAASSGELAQRALELALDDRHRLVRVALGLRLADADDRHQAVVPGGARLPADAVVGLVEELAALRVTSRTSAMQFKKSRTH